MTGRKPFGDSADKGRPREQRRNAATVRFDAVDMEILGYLVDDARLSQRALARAVGMSPPAVAERIGRLETSGVIASYGATVNLGALGRPMTVIVEVVSDRSAVQRDVAARLVNIPEVERVDVVTGATDLQVRLHVRDLAHLNDVLFESVLASEEIRHTETYLALSSFEPENFSRRLVRAITDEFTAREDES